VITNVVRLVEGNPFEIFGLSGEVVVVEVLGVELSVMVMEEAVLVA